ncbi:hypothetical protein WH47_05775 [Habropoda laboriosa]|uniref:Uncharacterized protein n=1 Tax=Habropoda laboriosa TaxID=597456 RepID=A0A0L7QSK8_9HYME|nr:hypothetical protein WH47_05775 [Habropoda laboriosa]
MCGARMDWRCEEAEELDVLGTSSDTFGKNRIAQDRGMEELKQEHTVLERIPAEYVGSGSLKRSRDGRTEARTHGAGEDPSRLDVLGTSSDTFGKNRIAQDRGMEELKQEHTVLERIPAEYVGSGSLKRSRDGRTEARTHGAGEDPSRLDVLGTSSDTFGKNRIAQDRGMEELKQEHTVLERIPAEYVGSGSLKRSRDGRTEARTHGAGEDPSRDRGMEELRQEHTVLERIPAEYFGSGSLKSYQIHFHSRTYEVGSLGNKFRHFREESDRVGSRDGRIEARTHGAGEDTSRDRGMEELRQEHTVLERIPAEYFGSGSLKSYQIHFHSRTYEVGSLGNKFRHFREESDRVGSRDGRIEARTHGAGEDTSRDRGMEELRQEHTVLERIPAEYFGSGSLKSYQIHFHSRTYEVGSLGNKFRHFREESDRVGSRDGRIEARTHGAGEDTSRVFRVWFPQKLSDPLPFSHIRSWKSWEQVPTLSGRIGLRRIAGGKN